MNNAPIYSAIDAALAPTWRLLWLQIRTFHDQATNVRAERLVMRFMDRRWSTKKIEQLLGRLIGSESEGREERHRHTNLAQVKGWGSAGLCPASHAAKTPAAHEQSCHVVEAALPGGDASALANAQRPNREVIV